MVKVLLFPGVEGIDPIRPSMALKKSSPFLLEGGNIGGLTIGGLLPLLFPTDAFSFFKLDSSLAVLELKTLLAPTSEEAFLLFPNMFKKPLAKLPVSLAAGVGGTEVPNIELMGADFVLEGGLRALIFCF
jgi:hypothetical protein